MTATDDRYVSSVPPTMPLYLLLTGGFRSFVLGSALNTGFRDGDIYKGEAFEASTPKFHSPVVKYPRSIASPFGVASGFVEKLVTLKDFKGFTKKPGGDSV